jgi:hypothetical protein
MVRTLVCKWCYLVYIGDWRPAPLLLWGRALEPCKNDLMIKIHFHSNVTQSFDFLPTFNTIIVSDGGPSYYNFTNLRIFL